MFTGLFNIQIGLQGHQIIDVIPVPALESHQLWLIVIKRHGNT